MKFPWQKTEDGKDEIDFPDELAAQIKKGAEAADKLTSSNLRLTSSKALWLPLQKQKRRSVRMPKRR